MLGASDSFLAVPLPRDCNDSLKYLYTINILLLVIEMLWNLPYKIVKCFKWLLSMAIVFTHGRGS